MSEPIQSISQGNYILATQQEVSHDNSLSGNGTVESPLGVVPGYNETVLYSGTAQTSALSFSEPLTAFERVLVFGGQVSAGNWGYTYLTPGGTNNYYAGFVRFVGGNNPVQIGGCVLNVNSQHTSGNLTPCGRHWFPTTTAAGGGDTNQFYFTQVIGINRKQ